MVVVPQSGAAAESGRTACKAERDAHPIAGTMAPIAAAAAASRRLKAAARMGW